MFMSSWPTGIRWVKHPKVQCELSLYLGLWSPEMPVLAKYMLIAYMVA